MSTQPEALRLAEALDCGDVLVGDRGNPLKEAAAELRRLSARCAELEAQAERLADMGLEVERDLVEAKADCAALRNALAAIYQALGTSNPDMTAWPAEIREMRNTIAAQAECIKANNDERQEWQREVVSLRANAERWGSAKAAATQQADALGAIFRIDIRRTQATLYDIDAAIDAERSKT